MPDKFVLAILTMFGLAAVGPAQVFLSDGFESYALGTLDKNLAAGPNAAPNGTGQPWFGPAPPNAQVVLSGDTIANGTPVNAHSGTKMIRGNAPSDLDQNWVNTAFRYNGGAAFTGNIALQFWFYDPLGAGGSNYRDFGAIGFYNTAPNATDYPGTGSLNGSTTIQRLALGASSTITGGFDGNFYQARIVGATDGYTNGWFNTTTPRTVGWHLASILIGPALGDNTNSVSFFIDNLTTPTLTHNSVSSVGYNVIELNGNFGPTTGYFDDITFSAVPEPSSLGMAACGFALVWRRRRAAGKANRGSKLAKTDAAL